jgi:hypothetical protein
MTEAPAPTAGAILALPRERDILSLAITLPPLEHGVPYALLRGVTVPPVLEVQHHFVAACVVGVDARRHGEHVALADAPLPAPAAAPAGESYRYVADALQSLTRGPEVGPWPAPARDKGPRNQWRKRKRSGRW